MCFPIMEHFEKYFSLVVPDCAHPLSEYVVQTSSSMSTKGTIGSQGESGCVSCIFASRGEAAGLFELSKSMIRSV